LFVVEFTSVGDGAAVADFAIDPLCG